MAYANTTKEMLDSPLEWTVCLSKIDCIVLRSKIKEMLFVTRKQFERLSDIYESGESTEEQVKSYEKTKQKYNTLSTTLMAMDDVIREQF